MTLKEFREFTEDMRGDVELFYSHADGFHPINTFIPIGDNLALCHKVYGQGNYVGIIESQIKLQSHDKERTA